MTENRAMQTGAPAAAVPLPEGQVPEWVMIARTGRWEGHPQGPELIGPEHLGAALDYFRRHYQAHGADLPIDYHHASVLASQGRLAKAPAAGWIRELELRADGSELWGRVLWTSEALADVAARRFRYLSPVFLFGSPDRVSGEPVPMLIHSVALTNTPFLTELRALNEQGAVEAGPQLAAAGVLFDPQGGEAMPILAQMATVLGVEADKLRSELALDSAEDKAVAQALVAHAARLRELDSRLAAQSEITNALGVPADADAAAIRHALVTLKASMLAPVLAAVRARLGLPEDAQEEAVLNAIEALQQERAGREAAQLVDGAIGAGRIPPSQRAFFLACARQDLESTGRCLNALPPMMAGHSAPALRHAPATQRELTQAELSVCRQLGLSAEAFLKAAE